MLDKLRKRLMGLNIWDELSKNIRYICKKEYQQFSERLKRSFKQDENHYGALKEFYDIGVCFRTVLFGLPGNQVD